MRPAEPALILLAFWLPYTCGPAGTASPAWLPWRSGWRSTSGWGRMPGRRAPTATCTLCACGEPGGGRSCQLQMQQCLHRPPAKLLRRAVCRCAVLAAQVRDEAQAWVRGICDVMAEADAPEWEALRQQARPCLPAGSLLGHPGQPPLSLGGHAPFEPCELPITCALHASLVLQASRLLEAVQLAPLQDEADVAKVKAAIAEAQAAAAGSQAACAALEERARVRAQYAAAADATARQSELEAIAAVRATWQQLAAAAAEREAQGVELAPPPGATASGGPLAGPAGEGSAGSLSRPSSVHSGKGRLGRTASIASTASSGGGRAKQSRGPSQASIRVAAA